MTRYRYEIDEANAVRVWDTENPNELGAPFLFQPTYPNNDAWGTAEAAAAWAEVFIAALENPESELIAGDSALEPTKARPAAPEEESPEESPEE